MRSTAIVAASVAALAGLDAAFAQELLHDLPGASPGDGYGTHVAAGGDLDGDGASELLIATLALDPSGATVWAVDVVSGRGGVSLRRHFAAGGEEFGAACLFTGDVDGDGTADYLVDAPDRTGGGHAAHLYSGASGALLRTDALTLAKDGAAARLTLLPDLDGDGFADYAASDAGPSGGHVDLVSTAGGKLLATLSSAGMWWASDVATLPDQDGDGLDDLAIGDPLMSVRDGAVWIHSSATGKQLAQLRGQTRDLYGSAVERIGDFDGDGLDELAVGAPRGAGNVAAAGAVFVHSGATLKIVGWLGGDFTGGQFGAHLADAGDASGDGVRDLAIGAPTVPTWQKNGPAYLVSGASLRTLYRFEFPDTMGWSGGAMAGAGDLDGDGLAELAIGDPELPAVPPAPGRVRVFRGNDLHLLATPRVAYAGDGVTLAAREGLASQIVLTAIVDLGGVPLFEVVDFAFFDADGARTLADTVPPGLAGLDVTFQSFAQKSPRGTRASARETLQLR